jgi:hypothetical protein
MNLKIAVERQRRELIPALTPKQQLRTENEFFVLIVFSRDLSQWRMNNWPRRGLSINLKTAVEGLIVCFSVF